MGRPWATTTKTTRADKDILSSDSSTSSSSREQHIAVARVSMGIQCLAACGLMIYPVSIQWVCRWAEEGGVGVAEMLRPRFLRLVLAREAERLRAKDQDMK